MRESEKSVMSKVSSMDRLDARLLVRLSMCACQGLGLPMSVCLLQENSIVSPNKYSRQKNMRHPWVRFLFYSFHYTKYPLHQLLAGEENDAMRGTGTAPGTGWETLGPLYFI